MMNSVIFIDEFEKLAGVKDFFINTGKKIINYSDGVKGTEEGLKGVNRVRQILKGDLAKKYFKEYQALPAGVEKETLMRKLVDEDTKSFQGKMLAGVGGVAGLIGTSELLNYGLRKATEGGSYLVRKGLLKGKEVKESKDPKEEFKNQLQALEQNYGKVPREIIERMSNPGYTDKLTVNEVMGIPTQAALSGATLGLTGKTMAGNLLGAQTFYHGTPKENVDSILRTGIDPSFGGREGGGAWKIDQKNQIAKEFLPRLREVAKKDVSGYLKGTSPDLISLTDELKNKLKDLVPDSDIKKIEPKYLDSTLSNLQAKMNLMGIGEDIPMDTTNFVQNAKGNSFVAKGLHGRAAATYYGRMIDPTSGEKLKHLTEGTMKKIGPLISLNKKHPLLAVPINLLYGATKMPIDLITEGRKYYNEFVTPKDTNVVGGVLPQEVFDQRFIRDPDDIIRMQSGMKTQQKVAPENLAKNEVSLGQIWKNRTREPLKYIKGNKGKVLSGLGLLGLNTLMTGATIHNTGRALGKIIPDSIKDKFRNEN